MEASDSEQVIEASFQPAQIPRGVIYLGNVCGQQKEEVRITKSV